MKQIYKTSQIAAITKVHPNTVRLYEELSYIPPVTRASNGYRMFTQLHLEHVLLVKSASNSTWLGGDIRQKALSTLQLSAAGCYEEAMDEALEHLILVTHEREKSELATEYVELWAANSKQNNFNTRKWSTKEVVEQLDITLDMLRSWERNGLITVPRNPDNGYRIYREIEIQRLYIIRALRKARFSLMSIYRMFQYYDKGLREGLKNILNELPPDEDNIFYHTDQWLTKVRSIEASAHEMIERLDIIKKLIK